MKTRSFSSSMNFVILGIALSMFSINFLFLEYVSLFLGNIFQLIGFRGLQDENKHFKIAYGICVLEMIYALTIMILATTIIPSGDQASQIIKIVVYISIAFTAVKYFQFWRGLIAAKVKAGLSGDAKCAGALVIFYVASILATFVPEVGIITVPIVLIGYILIIVHLSKLTGQVTQTGCEFHTHQTKFTDRKLVISIVAIFVIGATCGYTFGSSYSMDWHAENKTSSKETLNIRENLLHLGFPKEVLKDISDNDIKTCKGATKVILDEHYMAPNKEEKNLKVIGVGVKVKDTTDHYVLFHHFIWDDKTKFVGTESIQLWTANSYSISADPTWSKIGDVKGHILYDKDGKTLVSDYSYLGLKTYDSAFFMFEDRQQNTDVFANFSMPRKGKKCRGYLTYEIISDTKDPGSISSWLNYTHQVSRAQYPVITAMDSRIQANYSYNAFTLFQMPFNPRY